MSISVHENGDVRSLPKELIGLESLQQIEKLDLSYCDLTSKGKLRNAFMYK